MKIANYINLVLAAGLVAVSVQLARMYNSTGKEDNQMTNTENARFAEGDGNPVIDSIMTRHSVRAYTDEAVNEEQIETLLRAGMAAPTAMDKRPWHFVVITDREKLKAAAESMKNASMAAGAPLAIVVCGDMQKAIEEEPARQYWIQDCSAATENILLAAHAIGLGAVWCGIYPSEERVADARELFDLPQHLIPLNIIVIGTPKEYKEPKDKWDENAITRIAKD